jgi:hypothetical protein
MDGSNDSCNQSASGSVGTKKPEGVSQHGFRSNPLTYPFQGDEIRLGAKHDPNLLPDHQGPYFKYANAKLIQLDICDIDNNVILPRPGTVVLINLTLHWWVIKDKDTDRIKKVSFPPSLAFITSTWVYQVNTRSLRVLAKSDGDIEIPRIPILLRKKDTATYTDNSESPQGKQCPRSIRRLSGKQKTS